MSKTKHTPGPWWHNRFNHADKTIEIYAPRVSVDYDDVDYDEAEANARLICTAPDLLAFAHYMDSIFPDVPKSDEGDDTYFVTVTAKAIRDLRETLEDLGRRDSKEKPEFSSQSYPIFRPGDNTDEECDHCDKPIANGTPVVEYKPAHSVHEDCYEAFLVAERQHNRIIGNED